MVPLALLVGRKEFWWLSYLDFQRVGVIRTRREVGVDFGSAAEGPVVGDLVVKAEAIPVARAIGAAGHPTCGRGSFRDPAPNAQTCNSAQQPRGKCSKPQNQRQRIFSVGLTRSRITTFNKNHATRDRRKWVGDLSLISSLQ